MRNRSIPKPAPDADGYITAIWGGPHSGKLVVEVIPPVGDRMMGRAIDEADAQSVARRMIDDHKQKRL